MPAAPADDPVLTRFRAALDALYSDRIERVVLFGSRARGDAREDSDYDVAVFLKDLTDCWRELAIPDSPSPLAAGLTGRLAPPSRSQIFASGKTAVRGRCDHAARGRWPLLRRVSRLRRDRPGLTRRRFLRPAALPKRWQRSDEVDRSAALPVGSGLRLAERP